VSGAIPKLTPVQRGILRRMIALWSTGALVTLLCARRLGKTHLLCAYVDYFARHKSNALIKYAAATGESLRDFTLPIMEQVISNYSGPQPVWKVSESCWVYPNGSRIMMVGCDDRRKANRLRGPACDVVVVDEASFIPILRYVVESVFRYQLISRPVWKDGTIVSNTGGGVMVIASSAPESGGDDFATYVSAADEAGRLVRRTIWDATHLPREEIEELCKQAGGERSTAWRREALCEIVTDETRAVIPEMAGCVDAEGNWIAVVGVRKLPDGTEQLHHLLVTPPEHRKLVTVIDGGHIDMCVAALSYVDFLSQTLVIEQEVVMQRATARVIAQSVRDAERATWGVDVVPHRIADMPPQTIADLDDEQLTERLRVTGAHKGDKAVSVTHLRDLVRARRIIVHPRCRTIIAHLKDAVWNTSRSDFERREAVSGNPGHHYDGLDAVRYACDAADFQTDPRPKPVTLFEFAGIKRKPNGWATMGQGVRRQRVAR
jgi:hypothetical protein